MTSLTKNTMYDSVSVCLCICVSVCLMPIKLGGLRLLLLLLLLHWVAARPALVVECQVEKCHTVAYISSVLYSSEHMCVSVCISVCQCVSVCQSTRPHRRPLLPTDAPLNWFDMQLIPSGHFLSWIPFHIFTFKEFPFLIRRRFPTWTIWYCSEYWPIVEFRREN